MSHPARDSIYEVISSIRLIDPHTHINPHQPASTTLADLLGYHYYTELAHSAGMPKAQIEEEDLDPRELVRRLVCNLGPIDNTAQYRWLIQILQKFFGFEHDRLDESNWEQAFDLAEDQMRLADWPQMVLDQSNVQAVFLTNDFDDELSGFDPNTYIPCLRTDDLVFHLAKPQIRARLEACTGIEIDGSLMSLRESLRQRFEYFTANGGRACAISLPPSFEPHQVTDGRTATALDHVLRKGTLAEPQHQQALSRRMFWTLAELCDEYDLPFDLMIGVNRGVYSEGVFQGQDLYDSRVSLIQYADLFNAFPDVKFPISVLASVTNQELVSYSWIFPNVITNGHWWYSNTPSFIARDAAARLEAVPRTKQIGYYSDAYKLEFVWPKFDMYREILAGILADHFVGSCGWSEQRAIELGHQILRGNVDQIFGLPVDDGPPVELVADTAAVGDDSGVNEDTWENDAAAAGASAALAAGAIGMVEVDEANESPSESPSDATEGLTAEVQDQSSALEDTHDEFSTVYDDDVATSVESPVPADNEDIQGFLEDEQDREAEAELDELSVDDVETVAPDHPTAVDLDDTVKMETVEIEDDATAVDADEETLVDEDLTEGVTNLQDEDEIDLDPLPTEEEIQAVDVDDVELTADAAQDTVPDSEAIDAQADEELLDVGEIHADSDDEPTDGADELTGGDDDLSGEIRMLRGEESFSPDEDSLRLQADPITGELRFPVPTDEDDLDGLDDDAGIAETVDLGDESIDAEFESHDESDDPGSAETVDLESTDFGDDSPVQADAPEIAETFALEDGSFGNDDDSHSELDDPADESAGEVSTDSDYDQHHVLDDLGDEKVNLSDQPSDDYQEHNVLDDLGLDEFTTDDEAGVAESPAAADDSDDENPTV